MRYSFDSRRSQLRRYRSYYSLPWYLCSKCFKHVNFHPRASYLAELYCGISSSCWTSWTLGGVKHYCCMYCIDLPAAILLRLHALFLLQLQWWDRSLPTMNNLLSWKKLLWLKLCMSSSIISTIEEIPPSSNANDACIYQTTQKPKTKRNNAL